MFNEKRLLLFLNHEAHASFKSKRLTFAGKVEKRETVSENKKAPELKNTLDDLNKKTDAYNGWDASKGSGENLLKLAEKLYPGDKQKQSQAESILLGSLGKTPGEIADKEAPLKKEGCTWVYLENGKMKFFKNAPFDKPENEIVLKPGGVPITSPVEAPEAAAAPAPAVPGEKAEITNEEEAAAQAEAAKGKAGVAARAEYIEGGSESGKIKFKDSKTERDTKIYKLYPDAKDGDIVDITHYGKLRRAKFESINGEWNWIDQKSIGDVVKIYSRDTIGYVPAEEKAKPKVEYKGEYQVLGYMRIKQNADWNEIAKTFMCTGTRPNGQDYQRKDTKDASPTANSPQKMFEKLGYDADNKNDVAEYAKLLSKGNKDDKLNAWVIVPEGQNPRVQKEEQNKEQENVQKRERQSSREVAVKKTQEEFAVLNKNFDKLLGQKGQDSDFKLDRESIVKIVSDDKLWNFYWNGHLEGKERIVRGFGLWNVPENQIRNKLKDAITGTGLLAIFNSNEKVNFGDLLEQFKVYRNLDGKVSDSISEFKKEMVFQEIGKKVKGNQDSKQNNYAGLDEKQIKFYEEMCDKYKGQPELLTGEHYDYYVNIAKGAALIMDGLVNMTPKVSTDYAELRIQEGEERKEKAKKRKEETGREREDREIDQNLSPEERLLQTLFHPQNTEALEDMSNEGKKSTEAVVYREIEHNAKFGGKWDKEALLNELNSYIRNGLQKYLLATDKEKEDLKKKFGLYGEPLASSTDINELMNGVQFNDLNFPAKRADKEGQNWTRNLVQEGFQLQRETSTGSVEQAEKLRPWKTMDDLHQDPKYKDEASRIDQQMGLQEELKQAKHPETAMALQEFQREHPEEQFTKEEIKEDVVKMDRLLDIDLAADTVTGDFRIGISKPIDLGHGWKFVVGGGINVTNGQPYIGLGIVKQIPVSENWKAYFEGAAGIEPLKPQLFGGVGGGFVYTIHGEAWKTEITPFTAGGVGASASINMANIYAGPYVKGEVARKWDPQAEYNTKVHQAQESKGYNTVDRAQDVPSKAAAIRTLPQVGPTLFEIQVNNNWSDEKLVQFYDGYLKRSVELMALQDVQANAPVVSEYGIGGTIDPVKLAILISAAAFGGPALATPLGFAFFGHLGFVVGKKIVFTQEMSRSTDDMKATTDQAMIEKFRALYPEVSIEMQGAKLDSKQAIISNDFAGDQMQRMFRTKQNPEKVESDQFNPQEAANFERLQQEFLKHHMVLGVEEIEPGKKMYTLKPTEVESYQLFADPDMAAGNGVILKEGKIFVATSENLTKLHIRKFDAFYPGEVDGAVQHTIITVSDNPLAKIGNIAQNSDWMIESNYDRDSMRQGTAEFKKSPTRISDKTSAQGNMNTYHRLSEGGFMDRFYTADTPSEARVARESQSKQREADLEMTGRAFETRAEFDKTATIAEVKPSPEDFLNKSPQRDRLYRTLTTNPTKESMLALDATIKKECEKQTDRPLTDEELILYKERLFQLSMAEFKGGREAQVIEARLKWAETEVYTPFFKERLAKLQPPPSTNVTAEALAKAFISGIRNYLKSDPTALNPGDSIEVAVGYKLRKPGMRRDPAESGLTAENNLFRQGLDYSKFLNAEGERNEEQRTIARILFEEHNELPPEGQNLEFLQSRLAQKIFYIGDATTPNPLINMLSENPETSRQQFETLRLAKEAINKGQNVDLESSPCKEAIESLRNICQQVKDAQLGQGTPLVLDGVSTRAIMINGYYIMVQTTMESGIYNYCKNPSTVYNERLLILKPKGGRALASLGGTVLSSAQDVTINYRAGMEVQTIGLNAIADIQVDTSKPVPLPTPNIPRIPSTPPPQIHFPAKPVLVPQPAPGSGQVGGKVRPGQTNQGPSGDGKPTEGGL